MDAPPTVPPNTISCGPSTDRMFLSNMTFLWLSIFFTMLWGNYCRYIMKVFQRSQSASLFSYVLQAMSGDFPGGSGEDSLPTVLGGDSVVRRPRSGLPSDGLWIGQSYREAE